MYLLSLVTLLLVVAALQLRWAYRRRQLMSDSWDTVLGRLERVNIQRIRAVAELYLQPGKDQLRMEPDEMWQMVGGLQGIHLLKDNASVMLDLAVFAERWNWEHGPVISEMMRRDAIRLNHAVRRIELAMVYKTGRLRAPFHLQEAVSAYYLMRGRLIGLYQVSHAGLLPRLEAAL